MSRGAPRAPLTYEGEYDATRTYLPLRVVHVTAGTTRTGYLSTATTTGDDPATSPAIWLPLGGGGDGEHNGTGADSTAVGTGATAAGDDSTALGDGADASAGGSYGATALGRSATADASRGTAVGYAAAASGYRSTALGSASGVDYVADYGIAIGYSAFAHAAQAVVLGRGAAGSGFASTALGSGAHVDTGSNRGVALGSGAHVDTGNLDGIAVGTQAAVTGTEGIAIGRFESAGAYECWIGADSLTVHPHSGASSSSVRLYDTAGNLRSITINGFTNALVVT